jgi:hypothetical protein
MGALRTLLCLALLGFAVIVLVGPVLAILGVLLPFAIVGALAWVGFRFGRALTRRWRGQRARLVMVDVRPTPEHRPIVVSTVEEPRAAARSASRIGRMGATTMHVAAEMTCGAALGAALAILVDWQSGAGVEHAALGALIGSVVGFVVGGSRSRPALEDLDGDSRAATRAA